MELSLVRRVIDARYFATPSEVSREPSLTATPNAPIDWSKYRPRSAITLHSALESDISRQATVVPGDSLQKLILREYGFGRNDSRQAYSAVESKILNFNGLSRPEDLIAGVRLKIPALPPIAPKNPSAYNTRNLVPKASFYPELSAVATGKSFDFEAISYRHGAQYFSALRKGAPIVHQYLWLPTEEVQKERERLGARGDELEVKAEAVAVKFDAGTLGPVDQPFLTESEQMVLKAQLAQHPFQSPVLIVLDDGWPSDSAYMDSISWLSEAFNAIKTKFKYPVGANVQAALGSRGTSYPKETFHARHIERALAPLTSIDDAAERSQRRVRVVYLPITPAQSGAAGVLEDLITLGLVNDLMGEIAGDEYPPKDVVATFRKRARDIVARIPRNIGVGDVSTDKAVIESVLWFADLYARATGNTYVASFSWTTAKLRNRYADIRFNLGLLVVAAGNASAPDCSACRPPRAFLPECKCADNVAAQERWFAVRAVDGQDVVAVMNTARDGSLQCRSSLVGSQVKDPLAVGLDGTVTSDVCGTSFAAPRVAWLAAARLAYVDPKTLFPSEPDRGQQLRNIIRHARTGGSERGDQFNLSIEKLFKP